MHRPFMRLVERGVWFQLRGGAPMSCTALRSDIGLGLTALLRCMHILLEVTNGKQLLLVSASSNVKTWTGFREGIQLSEQEPVMAGVFDQPAPQDFLHHQQGTSMNEA